MTVIQQDFERYYGDLFGSRWETLRAALLKPERQVRRYNPMSGVQLFEDSQKKINWLPHCDWHASTESIPRSDSDLLTYYVLDPASVLVAENLKVKPGERVLDLCAAPGGKSLVLAQSLFIEKNPKSELILNELSPDRRERLKKVVQQYIPRDIRNQIWIKGKDGTRFGLEVKNYFDAILLDAPCSGERHLLENSKELLNWKIKRTKALSLKQYSLICSAWLALRPGGRLIYSTCALSPLENDELIQKFLKKKQDAVIEKIEFRGPGFESTQYGIIYLPDQSGFGPMFSCLLVKSTSP